MKLAKELALVLKGFAPFDVHAPADRGSTFAAVGPSPRLVVVAVSLHFSHLKRLGDQIEVSDAAVDLNLHNSGGSLQCQYGIPARGRQPSAANAQITVHMIGSSWCLGIPLYWRLTALMARSIASRPLETTTGL